MKVSIAMLAVASVVGGLDFAPLAYAEQNHAALATVTTAADEYTNLGEIEATIPRGISTWNLKLEEELTGGQLSVWHRSEAGCRGFDIVGIKAKAATDGAEWRSLKPTNWQGVTHFFAEGLFKEVEMTLSNTRLLPQQCRVLLRLANFEVPEVFTMLAKINAPACDGSDTPVCTYSAERIDTTDRQNVVLSSEDFEKFGLVAAAIYKLKGYNLETDGASVFRLISSQKIMQ